MHIFCSNASILDPIYIKVKPTIYIKISAQIKKMILKVLKQSFSDFKYNLCRYLNKLNINYKSYPKSTNIEAYEQKYACNTAI